MRDGNSSDTKKLAYLLKIVNEIRNSVTFTIKNIKVPVLAMSNLIRVIFEFVRRVFRVSMCVKCQSIRIISQSFLQAKAIDVRAATILDLIRVIFKRF